MSGILVKVMNMDRAHLATADGTDVFAFDEAATAAARMLAAMSKAANGYATAAAFQEYFNELSTNSRRARWFDLATWARFADEAAGGLLLPLWAQQWDDVLQGNELTDYQRAARAMMHKTAMWRGVEFGLVKAFAQWLLREGYAMGSIDRHLSTVRKYCDLAFQAGMLDEQTARLIGTVTGYAGRNALRKDEARAAAGTPTRRGAKKADWTDISDAQAKRLLAQPLDTPQGRRDAVLLGLLIEHGLRVGEAVGLQVGDVDRVGGVMTVRRSKVGRVDWMKIHRATRRAMQAYFDSGDVPAAGPLLRSSNKAGVLTAAGMSARAASERVRVLAERIGVKGLHAYDLRHYWATYWAARVSRLPRGLLDLQEAGGWNSLEIPRRYVERAEIANGGMADDGDE